MAVRTKQAIRQAFIELLNERPLDKISVKDIAERSTVNRNTFYYYYADIYALVEEIFQTETQLFMEKLHSYASWEEAFREATAFVSENKRAVHHLFNSGNRNILEHYYHKVTYAAMLSYVRGQAEGLSAAEEDIQALAQFYAAALSGMTADWLRGGMKSNVNDHIDRLIALIHHGICKVGEHMHAAAADADYLIVLTKTAASADRAVGKCGDGGRAEIFCGENKHRHENKTDNEIHDRARKHDYQPLPSRLVYKRVGIVGALVFPLHRDKPAYRQQTERICGAALFRCAADELRTHADGEFTYTHAEAARRGKVTELVNKYERAEYEQRDEN